MQKFGHPLFCVDFKACSYLMLIDCNTKLSDSVNLNNPNTGATIIKRIFKIAVMLTLIVSLRVSWEPQKNTLMT